MNRAEWLELRPRRLGAIGGDAGHKEARFPSPSRRCRRCPHPAFWRLGGRVWAWRWGLGLGSGRHLSGFKSIRNHSNSFAVIQNHACAASFRYICESIMHTSFRRIIAHSDKYTPGGCNVNEVGAECYCMNLNAVLSECARWVYVVECRLSSEWSREWMRFKVNAFWMNVNVVECD